MDYFSKLLGSNPSQNVQHIKAIREDDYQIKTGRLTMNELIIVLKNTQLKKADGIYAIPPEVWENVYSTYIYLYSATK